MLQILTIASAAEMMGFVSLISVINTVTATGTGNELKFGNLSLEAWAACQILPCTPYKGWPMAMLLYFTTFTTVTTVIGALLLIIKYNN